MTEDRVPTARSHTHLFDLTDPDLCRCGYRSAWTSQQPAPPLHVLRRLYTVADGAIAYILTNDVARRPDLLEAHAALDDTRRLLDEVARDD